MNEVPKAEELGVGESGDVNGSRGSLQGTLHADSRPSPGATEAEGCGRKDREGPLPTECGDRALSQDQGAEPGAEEGALPGSGWTTGP